MVRRGLVVVSASLAVACHATPTAPPLPEALVVVDTNLPTPLVAARLRVDLYSEDGTWFDSADFGRPDARDWPASFSVYSDDESRERHVFVRLRAYPEGGVDAYRGERFRDWSDPFADVTGDDQPRLVKDGSDVTPATEPSPLLTVDRLILVPLRPSTRGRVRVLLDGACVGTMVHLPDGGVPSANAESCVDAAKTRAPVALAALEDDMSRPTTSAVGTWLTAACPPPSDGDARVCVPGGATILGSREDSDYDPGSVGVLDPAPPRVFGLSPFTLDRDELTVKALRDAVHAGYAGPLPPANDGPLGQPVKGNTIVGCTWSLTAAGRDDYPVTCAGWDVARAICKYRGGDLLTEAQWEHVATIAGRANKNRYPWGQDQPTCAGEVWGRIPLGTPAPACPGGDGPRPLSEGPGDVSPLGVRGVFGSVSEWVLDDADPYASSAWARVEVVDPVDRHGGLRRVLRGESWMSGGNRPISRYWPTATEGYVPTGVRCAYGAASP